MIIRIKNLRMRTIIGVDQWERKDKQDVIINVEIEYDGTEAAKTDDINYAIDYKLISKKIIQEVTQSKFYLLDRLADHILKSIMIDKRIKRAVVEVDKPHALRFSDSVSLLCSAEREQ